MKSREQSETVALFLGAGFSKPWGLPLTSELMHSHDVKRYEFPGMWQRKTIKQIQALWIERADEHRSSVDQFGKSLRGTDLFTPFARYVALRLSSKLWHVGTSKQTEWGTGDHIRKQSILSPAYAELVHILRKVNLVGIVTTNYDIVLEKILGPYSSGRLGGFNYGTVGESLVGRHNLSSRWTYGPVQITGRIPIAKIHGSLNWAFSEDGGLIRYVDCRPSRGRRYKVALFPPGGAQSDPFRSVREFAQSILSRAKIWIVIGYSFPDDDEDVRDLLRRSASQLSLVCYSKRRSRLPVQRMQQLLDTAAIDYRCELLPEFGSKELPHRLMEVLCFGVASAAAN